METSNSLNSREQSSAVTDTGNDEAVPVHVEPAVADVNMDGDGDGNDERDADADADSEEDRKPAAIENNDGDTEDDAAADSEVDGDDDDDGDDGEIDGSEENASSDDNNDKDDDQDDQEENSSDDGGKNGRAGASGASPDGRQLSQYELLRQERIKRNKQYLAALGLEGTSASGVLGGKVSGKPSKRKRKRISPSQKRSSLSRRTKASVDYTEPPASVASLLRTNDKNEQEKKKDRPPKPPNDRKTKDPKDRLEKFVWLEFKSINAHKRQILSQAEKNLRNAGKEVKYWKKRAEVFERRQQRKLERKLEQAKIINQLEDERRQLGGGTAKELLQDIDNRMPDILSAVARYDAKLEVRLC
jgi:hypothetical protein